MPDEFVRMHLVNIFIGVSERSYDVRTGDLCSIVFQLMLRDCLWPAHGSDP